MKKKGYVLVAAALLAASMTISAYAGWEQDESGSWYALEDGSYVKDQFMTIDGAEYAFYPDGYMVKGWYQKEDSWYYFDLETGAKKTGWIQSDGFWYYMNPERGGRMVTDYWLESEKDLYYIDSKGKMKTGAFIVNGYYYFAEADGKIRRNVIETENGVTIRYDDTGMQWYKNNDTKVYGQHGGDTWLPVLSDSDLKEQFLEVDENNHQYITQLKDELYKNYNERRNKHRSENRIEKSIEDWKLKAARELSGVNVAQEEIDAYIYAVTHGLYGTTWYQENMENSEDVYEAYVEYLESIEDFDEYQDFEYEEYEEYDTYEYFE